MHVQTEYQGEQGGLVETLVFREGHIIFTHRNPSIEDESQIVDMVVENQHKRILTLIKNGLIGQLMNMPDQKANAEKRKKSAKKQTSFESGPQANRQDDSELPEVGPERGMSDRSSEAKQAGVTLSEDLKPDPDLVVKTESDAITGKYVSGTHLKQASPKEKDRLLLERIRKYWTSERGQDQSNWKKLEAVLGQMIGLMNDIIVAAVVTESGLPLALEHGSDIVFPTKELTRLFQNIMQFKNNCISPTLDFGKFEELHGYTTNVNFIMRCITERVFLILIATKQANLGKMNTIITQYSLMLKVVFD
ncbi:hypothetical protein JXQ70_20545 [bacterium]|nr:hypothetical protein [bacterium]